MTDRQHTKHVLNEFFGTSLALGGVVGAIGAGIYGAKRQLNIGAQKQTGFRYRLGQRLENQLGNKLVRHGRETLMKYSDKMQAETHDKIAQEYGLSARSYAQALAQQELKSKAQKAHSVLSTQGIDPATVHVNDIDNIISGKPLRWQVGNNYGHSIDHHSQAPTEFERLDAANPTAARFRKEMTQRVFGAQLQSREKLTGQIAAADRLSSIRNAGLEQDRARQKRKLDRRRQTMPSPLEPNIPARERVNRIVKRTFQKAVDTVRTIV